jgi:hypothetical protein
VVKRDHQAGVVRLCSESLVGGMLHRDYAIKIGVPLGTIFTGYDVVDNTHFQLGAIAARHMEMEARKRTDR